MKEFQQKKKRKKWMYSPYVILVMLVIFGLLLNGIWKLYQKDRQSAENLVEARSQLKTLSAEAQVLQAETSRLQTPQGVEEEIRQKFQVSKDGEQMLVIVKPTDATNTEASSTKQSFFGKIKAFFSKW